MDACISFPKLVPVAPKGWLVPNAIIAENTYIWSLQGKRVYAGAQIVEY